MRAVAYAGGRLFSAGDDKTVRCLEARSIDTIVHALPTYFASGSNVGNCASRLHTRADRCATSLLCRLVSLMLHYRCAGHTGYINALLAARGRIYSAGNDKTIRVWE